VQSGQNLRGLPIRLGVKLSPRFAHVLAVVANSAKIYFALSILRLFLAEGWEWAGAGPV
jgi:hypothetical protein